MLLVRGARSMGSAEPARARGASGEAIEVEHETSSGCLMYVDYSESPVGPYRELLFIPRVLSGLAGSASTISKIYVSTEASVQGGRRNWGIPKELAEFEVRSERRAQHIIVSVAGERALELSIESSRLTVPMTTTLFPARLRTLMQELDGARYYTTPQAHGLLHTAKVGALSSDGRLFPALSREHVLFASHVSHVRMTFPAAKIVV